MKSWRIFIFSVLCVFVLSSTVFAQGDKKIGFLDLSKVFDNYERTKEYDAILETDHKAYEKERNTQVEKLKESQGKLAILSKTEKVKVEEELEHMKNSLLEFDQERRTELTKQRDERIREILLEIEKVVSDFAKQEKYDLILNDRVLIFGDEALDVSDKILKILNDNYNKQ